MQLTEATFFIYAAQHYKNPSCRGMDDFLDDLNRFHYITRLLNRYKKKGELPDRLILNHIVLLHNVFGPATPKLLFFKIEREHWPQLKTFLIYLNYLPEHFTYEDIQDTDIPLDPQIVKQLREL